MGDQQRLRTVDLAEFLLVLTTSDHWSRRI